MSTFGEKIRTMASLVQLVRWGLVISAMSGASFHTYKKFFAQTLTGSGAQITPADLQALATQTWGSAAPQSEALEIQRVRDEEMLKTPPKVGWGRDPFFKSPGFAPFISSKRDYKLEAIIYDEEAPTALIDGNLVTPGQMLPGGVKIQQIGRSYVILIDGENLRELVIGSAEKPTETSPNAPRGAASVLDFAPIKNLIPKLDIKKIGN